MAVPSGTAPTLDQAYFPGIVEGVLTASLSALLDARALNRAWRAWAEGLLFAAVEVDSDLCFSVRWRGARARVYCVPPLCRAALDAGRAPGAATATALGRIARAARTLDLVAAADTWPFRALLAAMAGRPTVRFRYALREASADAATTCRLARAPVFFARAGEQIPLPFDAAGAVLALRVPPGAFLGCKPLWRDAGAFTATAPDDGPGGDDGDGHATFVLLPVYWTPESDSLVEYRTAWSAGHDTGPPEEAAQRVADFICRRWWSARTTVVGLEEFFDEEGDWVATQAALRRMHAEDKEVHPGCKDLELLTLDEYYDRVGAEAYRLHTVEKEEEQFM